MRVLFEPRDETTRSSQCLVEIVDAKKQKKAVAGRPVIGGRQRRMIVGASLSWRQKQWPYRLESRI